MFVRRSGISKLEVFLRLCAYTVLSFSMLISCASKPTLVNVVELTPTLNYRLQAVPSALVNKGIQSLFTIEHEQSDKKILIQVEMTANNILVSGMTLEGFSLFTIDWNEQTNSVVIDNFISIDPLRILAELQLSLWPVRTVNQGLSSAVMTSSAMLGIADIERKIIQDSVVLYSIKQVNKITTLNNKQQDYSLKIEELDRWTLSTKHAEKPSQEQQ